MKHLIIPTLVITFSFAATYAQAEIFKWQDTDGKTHYSQTPPPKSNAKDIEADIRMAAGAGTESHLKNHTASKEKTQDNSNPELNLPAIPDDLESAKAVGDANKLKHEDYCKQQELALKQITANPVINWRDEKGTHLLTADERAAKLKELSTTMSTICSAAVRQETDSGKTPTTDEKKP